MLPQSQAVTASFGEKRLQSFDTPPCFETRWPRSPINAISYEHRLNIREVRASLIRRLSLEYADRRPCETPKCLALRVRTGRCDRRAGLAQHRAIEPSERRAPSGAVQCEMLSICGSPRRRTSSALETGDMARRQWGAPRPTSRGEQRWARQRSRRPGCDLHAQSLQHAEKRRKLRVAVGRQRLV